MKQLMVYYKTAHKDHVLKKRYPQISIAAGISLIILTFGSIFYIIYQSNIDDISCFHSNTWYIFMPIIGISFSCIEGTGYALAFRFWIIYYQIQLSKIVDSHEWRILIDSKYKIEDIGVKNSQWFINHKKDLGNYHFCQKIFLICGCFGATLSTCLFMT